MIAILCPDWYDAVESFHFFLSLLEDVEGSEFIETIYESENCVETDDNLRYIFIDYRFAPVFTDMHADIINVDTFFEECAWGPYLYSER